MVSVNAEDNAHIVLDFGEGRFASIATGFTIQKYKSPAVELYGATGTLQMLGDDWAPDGFEQWSNERGSWELFGETDTQWPWTEGLRHLVESIETGPPTVTRPEHAFHALEVMLAARQSAAEGRVVEVAGTFPELVYVPAEAADGDDRSKHDPRSDRRSHRPWATLTRGRCGSAIHRG